MPTPTLEDIAARLGAKMERAPTAGWKQMLTGKRVSGTTVTLAGAPAGKVWVRGRDSSREETAVWGTAADVNVNVWVGKDPRGELEIKQLDNAPAAEVNGDAMHGLLALILPGLKNLIIQAWQSLYEPAVPSDWTPLPLNVKDALDQLAARPQGGGVTDGTTTVDPATLVNYDPDYFDVTNLGGSTAGVTAIAAPVTVTDGVTSVLPLSTLRIGTNLTLTDNGSGEAELAGSGGTGGHEILVDDVPQTQRGGLNFLSSDWLKLASADDAGNDETEIGYTLDPTGVAAPAVVDPANDRIPYWNSTTGTMESIAPEDLPTTGDVVSNSQSIRTEIVLFETTLVSAAASIVADLTLNALYSQCKDLRIIAQPRGTTTGVSGFMYLSMRPNGAGSNTGIDSQRVYGTTTTVGADRFTFLAEMPSGDSPSGSFAAVEAELYDFNSTTKQKLLLVEDASRHASGTGANTLRRQMLTVDLGITAAISSLTFVSTNSAGTATGNLEAGTHITILGSIELDVVKEVFGGVLGGSVDFAALTPKTPVATDKVLLDDGTNTYAPISDVVGVAAADEMGGRLTLTTGVPVTITDVSAATTLYYTPYLHNRLLLYDTGASEWRRYTFAEVSASLSGLTAARPYDVFIYDNGGTITLELVAWTNGTTRATALTKQDGRYVKTGAVNRRYVGTIQIAATGQCEDSVTNRLVQNYYHRRLRRMRIVNATGHTYATATVRSWNNDATVRVTWVQGVQEDPAQFFLQTRVDMVATSGLVQCNVGINTTSANSLDGDQFINQAVGALNIAANGSSYGALGSNYAQVVETGVASNSPTFQIARLNGYVWG